MFKRHRVRGMTLVELLVVITILMLLAGFMVPRIPGMVQGQRLREASRAVHVAISTARGRAMELGRPCGIRIESRPGSSLLRVVETKPGFSGWTENSKGTVTIRSSDLTLTLTDGVPETVQAGGRVLLGGRRPELLIDKVESDSSGSCVITASRANSDDIWPWIEGAVFQSSYLITPNPDSPQFVASSRRPMVLPAQTTVDLGWSGEDQGYWDEDPLRTVDPKGEGYSDNKSPTPDAVTVLFDPDGVITQVVREYPRYGDTNYTNVVSADCFSSEPVQAVYLLVGRPDQVDSDLATQGIQVLSDAKNAMPDTIDRTNLADGDCRWIAINARTGQTVTNLNIAQGGETFSGYAGSDDNERLPEAIWNARGLVRDGRNEVGN